MAGLLLGISLNFRPGKIPQSALSAFGKPVLPPSFTYINPMHWNTWEITNKKISMSTPSKSASKGFKFGDTTHYTGGGRST